MKNAINIVSSVTASRNPKQSIRSVEFDYDSLQFTERMRALISSLTEGEQSLHQDPQGLDTAVECEGNSHSNPWYYCIRQ
jgi:hypothetical protein